MSLSMSTKLIFDLAVIIVHYYDFLSTRIRIKRDSLLSQSWPLRPSAFRSASKLSWWKQILYHCKIYECILSSFVEKGILVEPLDTERQMKENLAKMEKQPESDKLNYPKDYATLYDFFAGSSSVTALIVSTFLSREVVPENQAMARFISEGNWEKVIEMYENNPTSHIHTIEEYQGTALHVAVDMDEVDVAQYLLRAILKPQEISKNEKIKALEKGNEDGDTPLHYAASRDITKMCVEIIGRENERMYLASRKNKHGETPLFQAAINGRKEAFAYLSNISDNSAPLQDLVGNDGDTILHCAIRNEYFDLAVIILHYYDFLSIFMNKDGEYPLHVLATRPSAFKSIHVEQLDARSSMEALLEKTKNHHNSDEVNYPKNYTVLIAVFTLLKDQFFTILCGIGKLRMQRKNQGDLENLSNRIGLGTRQVGFLPPNHQTILQFVKYHFVLILGLLGQGETSDLGWLKKEKEGKNTEVDEKILPLSGPSDTIGKKNDVEAAEKKNNDKRETAFFVAARNGIVEMVNEILSQKPMVIRETNSWGDNVLHVAVRNRKSLVVKSLETKLRRKRQLWHEWLRETSESCSVLAALVAGASFATAATIPGGTDDKGKPHLEDYPTFEAFVIASLIGLCFSVTGLIMFLTILTSRKLHRDFRKDLPRKLLFGLSSLFVSIVALLVSFCTGHSFLFTHEYKMLILPIYVATCLPVTFYAVAQLPLYFDLLTAILVTVPRATDEGDSKWEGVIDMYRNFPTCQITKITESLGTALHVAVDMNKEDAVEALVNQIIEHLHHAETNPLEVKNKSGDTPLHVAASRGFAKICKIIIGKHNERKSLVSQRNNRGETPLFQAVINGHSQAFCYLSSISHDNMADLVRDNKDTILHCAISNEYFGKMSWQNKQVDTENPPINEQFGFGLLPPNYNTFQQFVRSGFVHILGLSGSGVDINEVKKTKERHQWGYQLFEELMMKMIAEGDLLPDREFDPAIFNMYSEYTPEQGECSHSQELEEETRPQVDGNTDTLSQNDTKKETDQHFDEQNIVIIRREITRSEVLEEKRKPKVDGRIETLCQSEARKEVEQHADEKNIFIIRRETKCLELLEEERKPKAKTSSDILDDDTVLVAARNGIVEIVNEILTQFISVFYTTNSQEENILLVAVRNKKPLVVENLRKKFQKEYPEVWNTLTLAVNKDGKTMLHMAAYASEEYKPWQISGSALQLMWDVNWFQYIKSLVPEHYHLRSDKNNQTADEIFKEEHKELRKESSEWLKETSESCSVVAALVAGVSFATAATIPGGNDDKGYPHLEDKPAFHAFVISSVVGLGFSLTGLIMFLTILTSRKLYRAFRIDLPLKLLLGLSSLFQQE
ncbi:Inversin-A [Glycine soja]